MHYTSARVSKRGNRYRAFLSFKDEAGASRQVSKTLDARGISQAKRELAAWRAEMEARADAEDRKGASGREAASMAVPDYVDRYVDAAESARTVELELTEVTVAALISIYTGLREGEVCGLQWRDVDIVAGVLWVRRSIGVGDKGSYVKAPKTDKTRDVALPASLAKVLDKWKVHQTLAFAEKGALLRPDHYVIGDPLGFLCPATVSRGWKLLSTMIGIKGTAGRTPTFHDLRHTWATMYLAAGGDVKTAASNLGHANAAMTLNVYASCGPEAKRRAAELTEWAMTGNPEA